MRGKTVRRLAALLLPILLLGTLSVTARAETVNAEFTVKAGEKAWLTIDSPNGEDVDTYTMGAGTLPPGMTHGYNADALIIHGTPDTPGEYQAGFDVVCGGTGFQYVVRITVEGESTAAQQTQPAPANGAPIILDPQPVTVTAGGRASFSADAQGWKWCAWRFVSPDGQNTVIFDVTEPWFPGLKIDGGNSLTMEIWDIPMELNGWKAVCLFSTADNIWTYTEGAVITVEPEATPEPEVTPEPTPESALTSEASPTPPEVHETPAPTAEPPAVAQTVPAAAPAKEDHTRLFVFSGLAAVAMICATVLIVHFTKRRRDDYDDYDD